MAWERMPTPVEEEEGGRRRRRRKKEGNEP